MPTNNTQVAPNDIPSNFCLAKYPPQGYDE